MNYHFKWLALALLLFNTVLFSSGASYAQTPNSGSAISGVTINRSTKNVSVVIASSGTFQTVLTSILGTSVVRQALTIENNNLTYNCYLFIGTGTPTAATSILLLPGGSYTRYWPYVPSDAFQATCSSAAEPATLYIDVQ